MNCIGCGGPATGELRLAAGVVTCRRCWERFIAAFDRFGDDPPREGIALPESPITRIADALLVALGAPPAETFAPPARARRARWVPARNRVPRRKRLRR